MIWAAIPYIEGTHLKYFTEGREVYDEYYGLMVRCSAIFDLRHEEVMWDKMDAFLRTKDSDRTIIEAPYAATVPRWDLQEYLDVLETAVVVTRIKG